MATGKALEVSRPRGASSLGRGVDRSARGGLAEPGVVAAKLCSSAGWEKNRGRITFLRDKKYCDVFISMAESCWCGQSGTWRPHK